MDDHRGAWGAAGGVLTGVFGGAAVVWYLAAHSATSGLPLWPVIPFTVVALVGLYCVFAPLLRLPPWRHQTNPEGQQGDTYNVTSHGQSGGVTAAVVHIVAPQPSVHVSTEAENEKTDDGYTTTVRVHLDAPYAAQNLVLLVRGAGVRTYGVNRVDPSASLSTGAARYRGESAIIVGAPLTREYRVFIVTDAPASGLRVEAVTDAEVQ